MIKSNEKKSNEKEKEIVNELKRQGTYIEILEYYFLKRIWDIINKEKEFILKIIRSRHKWIDYWVEYTIGPGGKRISELGIGMERLFHTLIPKYYDDWLPQPVGVLGSNLFYSVPLPDDLRKSIKNNAETYKISKIFLNIDIKTVYADNTRDYGGVVEVGEAQTSYPMIYKSIKVYKCKYPFIPKLRPFYIIDNEICVTLTYILQVIQFKPEELKEYEDKLNLDPVSLDPISILLVCVPNGLLYDIYGENAFGDPKSYHTSHGKRVSPSNFRFYYKLLQRFELLRDKPYRMRLLFNITCQKIPYYKPIKNRITPTYILGFPVSEEEKIICYFN